MVPSKHKVIKAYKYVDLEHADAVARGSLKIGTLASYANLEGARADDADGVLSRSFGDWTYTSEAAQVIELAGSLPFSVAPGAGIRGIEFVEKTEPMFCFCASRRRNDRAMMADKPQAVFEISDFIQLSLAISKAEPRKLKSMKVAYVEYKNRNVSAHFDLSSRADPFIKDITYSGENEIRTIWKPRPLAEMTPIFTRPNWFLQRYLKRIA